MAKSAKLKITSTGNITGANPLNITAGLSTHTPLTIDGSGFSDVYYKNRVRLAFVKDTNPTYSPNVSVEEPDEEKSGTTKLVVGVRALLAVLEEVKGESGDNKKFKIIIEVLNDNGSVADTIVGSSRYYIEFLAP